MTKKIITIWLLAGSLALSACAAPVAKPQTTPRTGQSTDTAKSSGQTVTLEEYDTLKQESDETISALKDEIASLKKGADDNTAPDNSAIAFRQRPAGMLYFPVFTLDAEMKTETAGYVAIKPQATLTTKLKDLTRGISRILFEKRDMEVVSIKTVNNKKIVTINLKGQSEWNQVFQGTTNGGVNSQALVLSYLQKDYRNGWIDGVRFLMDGQPIELEHTPLLEEIQFRK